MKPAEFPKMSRLLKSAEFDHVFAAKKSVSDGVLVVYAMPSKLATPRLGLVVSRKVGCAVRRNRWKRLLREAFRLSQGKLPALDLICIPRLRGEPSLELLQGSLATLAARVQRKVHSSGGRRQNR